MCFFNVSIVICVNSDSVTGLAFTVGLLRSFGGNGEGIAKVEFKGKLCSHVLLPWFLWFARNKAYWDAALMTPAALIKRVQFDVCTRVQQLIGRKWTEADRSWFDQLLSVMQICSVMGLFWDCWVLFHLFLLSWGFCSDLCLLIL